MTSPIHDRVNGAEVHSIFGQPDPSILSAGRRDAVEMPGKIFGPVWGMVCDFANGAGCPPDYAAIALLSACASLIGGKRWVMPYTGISQWSEPSILWVAAVGDPSANKSPGLDAITAPLRKMEKAIAESHKATLRDWNGTVERAQVVKDDWQAQVKLAVKDGLQTPAMPTDAVAPDEPARRRLIVQDGTPEAIASILAGNDAGTFHFRDELAGWLLSFDRYSPGGREFWLEAYGGRSFVIDRKSAGCVTVNFNGVSVLGGVQPEKLADTLLSSVDDGLVARFLWAWPQAIPFRRPSSSGNEADLQSLYERLDGLEWGQDDLGANIATKLHLTRDAADIFDHWGAENDLGIEDAGTLYKSFCGKLRGMVLRIALVSELIKWAWQGGDEPHLVTAETVGAVCDFIEQYGKPMALRVFGDAALPPVERNAATLARYIKRNKLDKFNARYLRRKAGYTGPKQPKVQEEGLELLVECNWIMAAPQRAGGTNGRQSLDFIVNPAVHLL